MTLDQEYFDSVNMDVVKRKYYEADKVDELLGEIRLRAESTNRENAELRGELDLLRPHGEVVLDLVVQPLAVEKHL